MTSRDGQQQLEKLLFSGRQYHLPKGQVMQFDSEQMNLSILESGFIKRYLITKEGTHSIQAFYRPHDIFPLTPVYRALFDQLLYTGKETFYYEAMTPAVLYSISREVLVKELDKNPTLYKDLFFACGVRLRSNIQRLENISLRSAFKQVAHQLSFMAEEFGTPTNEGIVIDIPMTHLTLSNTLNVARETVSHNMSSLQKRGLIKTSPTLTILDLDGLKKIAR